jgi:hypothetical protein
LGLLSFFGVLGRLRAVNRIADYGNISSRVNHLFTQVPKVQIIANAATFGSVIGNIEHWERTSFFLPECVEDVF